MPNQNYTNNKTRPHKALSTPAGSAKPWKGAYDGPTGPTIKVTSKYGEEELCEHDYNVLKDAGMLWELFPDAPHPFPRQNTKFEGGTE